MEDLIREELRKTTEPMTAAEIGNKIGKERKDINRVIYKMTDVLVITGKTPPCFKLKDANPNANPLPSSSSERSTVDGATPNPPSSSSRSLEISDDKVKEGLLSLLTGEPQSAADLQKKLIRKLNNSSIDTRQVKRVLYSNPDIASNVTHEGGKPMYIKPSIKPTAGEKKGDTSLSSLPATKDGQQLYVKEEREDGNILFKNVTLSMNSKEKEEEVKSKTNVDTSIAETTDHLSSLSLTEEIDDDRLKELIMNHLKSHPGQSYTPREIAEALKQPTRDKTLYCLEELAENDKIIEVTNDGKYYYPN